MLRTLRGAHRHPGCACTQTIQRPRPSDYRAALAYHYLRSFPLQGRVDVGESACDLILHRGNRNPELFPNLSVGKLVNTVKQKYFSHTFGQLGQGAAKSSHHVLRSDTVLLLGWKER